MTVVAMAIPVTLPVLRERLSKADTTPALFSPDEMKLRIPLPPNTQRPDNYDFFLEYYDINGNTAEATTFVNNVRI